MENEIVVQDGVARDMKAQRASVIDPMVPRGIWKINLEHQDNIAKKRESQERDSIDKGKPSQCTTAQANSEIR